MSFQNRNLRLKKIKIWNKLKVNMLLLNEKKWSMILTEIGMIKMNKIFMMTMKIIILLEIKKNIDKLKNKLTDYK